MTRGATRRLPSVCSPREPLPKWAQDSQSPHKCQVLGRCSAGARPGARLGARPGARPQKCCNLQGFRHICHDSCCKVENFFLFKRNHCQNNFWAISLAKHSKTVPEHLAEHLAEHQPSTWPSTSRAPGICVVIHGSGPSSRGWRNVFMLKAWSVPKRPLWGRIVILKGRAIPPKSFMGGFWSTGSQKGYVLRGFWSTGSKNSFVLRGFWSTGSQKGSVLKGFWITGSQTSCVLQLFAAFDAELAYVRGNYATSPPPPQKSMRPSFLKVT